MDRKTLGRTGLQVSRLSFGCGAVGGLMTKGAAADQNRAVAWARDRGVNFFDTAASYGDGASEINLGRALGGKPDGVVVGTKVGLAAEDMADIEGAVARSLDASLARLGMDHVDLFQLHNMLGRADHRAAITPCQVLDGVVPAFEKLKQAGKTRFLGFTAKGEAGDLHELVASERFDSAQVFYNLLAPSAGEPVPPGYPDDGFRELLVAAERHGVGAIGVRVLAGGALTGSEARHPLGMRDVVPIGSNTDYATDVRRGLRFMPLVAAGHAASLPELAIRYAVSNPALPTVEIGIATLEQLQLAAAAVRKGPLPADALAEIRTIQRRFAKSP